MVAKVELHLHLEGAIAPELMLDIAGRNKIDAPRDIIGPNSTYIWQDFMDFLNVYDKASQVLRTGEDYYAITYDYLKRCANEGAIYVEFMPSPDHAELCGISYDDMLAGCIKAIDDAKRDFNIDSRIIITCVRHFGVEKCIKVAEETVKRLHPYIVGFGMGGDELGFPPGQFAKAYHIAHEAGLRCNVHAGEWGDTQSMWEAIDKLPVQRLGHGVRAIEDPNLIAALIDRDIALEVCPGSNIALGVYNDFSEHPFVKLRDAGVKVSLSSDDPPFFNTTLGKEYETAKNVFGLSESELNDITHMAIDASFADDVLKETLRGRV
ncbi:MAG: adenosine deaminase [Legionellales bacterium]|nr:adenosine deaminase [Legionellales bacterium]|tara:strand:+ start:119 stop:1084 length:966 start_codon:yes stop_codon:yes gene_type:complete